MNGQEKDLELALQKLDHENLVVIKDLFVKGMDRRQDPIERAFLFADFIQQSVSIYHEAASDFYSLIKAQPEDPWPHLYHGLASLMGGLPKWPMPNAAIFNAMADFNGAIIADRQNPVAYYARAKARFYAGEYLEALEDARVALACRDNSDARIDYGRFVEFLEDAIRNGNPMEYVVGDSGPTLRAAHANEKDGSDEGWISIDQSHRFRIRPGDRLRQYVRPYSCPDDIFYNGYEVSEEPHFHRIICRGTWMVESIGFADGSHSATESFFQNEVWIKREGLTHWTTFLDALPVFL